jgi:ribonuclease Z
MLKKRRNWASKVLTSAKYLEENQSLLVTPSFPPINAGLLLPNLAQYVPFSIPPSLRCSNAVLQCFIVVCCPDDHYVDSLVSSPAWLQYYDSKRDRLLAAVVHMTPVSVMSSEKYIAWINKFPASTQHIILNRDLCNTEDSNAKFKSFFSNLVQIDPNVFYAAQHGDSSFTRIGLPTDLERLNSDPKKHRVISGDVGLVYNLVPCSHMGVVQDPSSSSLPLSPKERSDFEQHDDQLRALIGEYQQSARVHRASRSHSCYDIHFLGTGAASASSLRNEAGILVDIHGYGSFIMDCGSHTYTQMAKKFGHSVKAMLKRLKLIWISHRHPDHNGGLLHILVERQHVRQNYAPSLRLYF